MNNHSVDSLRKYMDGEDGVNERPVLIHVLLTVRAIVACDIGSGLG